MKNFREVYGNFSNETKNLVKKDIAQYFGFEETSVNSIYNLLDRDIEKLSPAQKTGLKQIFDKHTTDLSELLMRVKHITSSYLTNVGDMVELEHTAAEAAARECCLH